MRRAMGISRSIRGCLSATVQVQLRFCRGGRPVDQGKKRPTIKLFSEIFWQVWPKKGNTRLRLQVGIAVSCVFATKLFGVAVPYWFKGVVDTLSSDPAVVAAAFNPIGTSLLGLVIAHSLFRTLQFLTQEARGALFAPVVNAAMRNLGVEVATHLHRLPLSFHLNRQTGGLSRIIDRGSKAVDRLLNFTLFHIIPTALELSLVSIVLYIEAGLPFTLTALGAVTAYTVFTVSISNWRISVRKKMNKADAAASVALVDGLINFETVKYFQNEKHEIERFGVLVRAYEKEAVLTQQSLGLLNFGQQFIFTAALGVALGMSAMQVSAGLMTIGDLVLVNTLFMQLSVPLNFLGTVYRELQTAVTDMEALFALLRKEAAHTQTNCPPFQFKGGEIEFRNVSFRYKEDQPMLNNVSFKVPGGTSLGIVGPSGCGKSTVMRLVFRFFDPVAGQILVDGQDVSKVDIVSLRRYYGVIPQDTVLFNDTLMHNLKYGRLEATDEECIAASKQADLDHAISTFVDGYNTRVGERGLKLSGGEKQRVAIARCLLRNAPILLMDEATSALDTRTEAQAMTALRNSGGDTPVTSLIIAHRLSTVKDCDRILVLKHGAVHEAGTHDELLAQNGLYCAMWNRQAQVKGEKEVETAAAAA